MGTVLSGEELLGDHKSLVLRKVERDAGGWIVDAAVSPEQVSCPDCGQPSNSRHSTTSVSYGIYRYKAECCG